MPAIPLPQCRSPYRNDVTTGGDGDTDLMLRVGREETATFEELYERYRRRVYGQLFALIHDHHAAEDLCHDVFLRIYRYRRSFAPRARFGTWLFCITRRVGLNALRNRRRLRRRMTCTSDLHAVAGQTLDWYSESVSPTPDLCLARQERTACVRAALDCLPERQQTAIVLQQFQQSSYVEIARKLQATPGSVKRLLVRARRSLQRMLVSESIVE